MAVIGRLEGIAPGEKIYSTRFAGERIYMVTFRQMDPFFVIDASDPKKLEMLGYLKIPGFSSYMHILDKDHVLGLGYDTEERNGGASIRRASSSRSSMYPTFPTPSRSKMRSSGRKRNLWQPMTTRR
jgi:hypothetical protein